MKKLYRILFDICFCVFKMMLPLNLYFLDYPFYQKPIRWFLRKVEKTVEILALKANPNF